MTAIIIISLVVLFAALIPLAFYLGLKEAARSWNESDKDNVL
jgi:hypothetical protein